MLLFIAGVLLGSVAVIGWLSSCRLTRLALQRKAARSLGASEWRIFWRLTLPGAWLQIVIAALLALASVTLVTMAVA